MIYLKRILALIVCIAVAAVCFALPAAAEEVFVGDADGDGEVAILDATLIQRVLVKMQQPGEGFRTAADVDLDGEVTILDATLIQRFLVKSIPSLPFAPNTPDATEAPTAPATDSDGWGVIIYRP